MSARPLLAQVGHVILLRYLCCRCCSVGNLGKGWPAADAAGPDGYCVKLSCSCRSIASCCCCRCCELSETCGWESTDRGRSMAVTCESQLLIVDPSIKQHKCGAHTHAISIFRQGSTREQYSNVLETQARPLENKVMLAYKQRCLCPARGQTRHVLMNQECIP